MPLDGATVIIFKNSNFNFLFFSFNVVSKHMMSKLRQPTCISRVFDKMLSLNETKLSLDRKGNSTTN